MAGKYGCGKTTTAKIIQRELNGFELIAIDETRSKMGITQYRREDTPRVMQRMHDDMTTALCTGGDVIVERPHQTSKSRFLSYAIARQHGRTMIILECTCPEDVAKVRISRRVLGTGTHLLGADGYLSANDPAIYDRISRLWENIGADFRKDSSLRNRLSYVVYDSHEHKITLVNQLEIHREFIEKLSGILREIV